MKQKHKIYIVALILFMAIGLAGVSSLPALVFAQDDDVNELQGEITGKKDEISNLKERISIYEQQIRETQQKAVSLRNQTAIIENQIAENELEIEIVTKQIEATNLEIRAINRSIEQAKKDIEEHKLRLAEIIRSIFISDQTSYLEVMLVNESFSEFFDQYQYQQELNSNVQRSLESLKDSKADLETQKNSLVEKKSEEIVFKDELQNKKVDFQEKLIAREILLSETVQSERSFQSYTTQLKQEHQQINADIVTLEKRIREELERREAQQRFESFGPAKFRWPTDGRYVTAYFHDPDYPFRHIFEHPAIDIRASQNTPVKAAESGYVARTKDGGRSGYSYIMIIHNEGFATVYGHVTRIDVNEDQYVNQGDVIGLSGGAPGTPGAGRFSTGSHLHFETRLNGIPVNALEYLPRDW